MDTPKNVVVVGQTYDSAHQEARRLGLVEKHANGEVRLTVLSSTGHGLTTRGSLVGLRLDQADVHYTADAHRGAGYDDLVDSIRRLTRPVAV